MEPGDQIDHIVSKALERIRNFDEIRTAIEDLISISIERIRKKIRPSVDNIISVLKDI